MRKHRIKYNWIHIINELDLVKAFDEYRESNNLKQHLKNKKSLSENRLARSFCLHFRGILPLDLSWAIKGRETSLPDIFDCL